MIVSYTHQFLFFHIPKSAGNSIRQALDPFVHQNSHYMVNRLLTTIGFRSNHYIGPYHWKRFCAHANVEHVKSQLPPEIYDNLFKFTFVRNPWDLMVSCYHFILQNPRHHRHAKVKSLGSFEAYLNYEAHRDKFAQRDYIVDRHGKPAVDFVGRMEFLNEDFQEICSILGLKVSLPHANSSRHKDYRDYYTPQTREQVRQMFREDIELLGYEFGVLPEQSRRIRLAA